MVTYVTDRLVLRRPYPTAHLAWLPVLHRGNTTAHPVTKILEKWSEMLLYLFHRDPSISQGLLDEVERVILSKFIVRYANRVSSLLP